MRLKFKKSSSICLFSENGSTNVFSRYTSASKNVSSLLNYFSTILNYDCHIVSCKTQYYLFHYLLKQNKNLYDSGQ